MILTREDYSKIAKRVEVGANRIQYEKGDEVLFVDYELLTEGYVEDDFHCGYMNGTGAWIETWSAFSVKGWESFNDDGESTVTEFDEKLLERIIS